MKNATKCLIENLLKHHRAPIQRNLCNKIVIKFVIFVIKLTQFVITVAFVNKIAAFCNKTSDAFVLKKLSHFVMSADFVIKCHNELNMKP